LPFAKISLRHFGGRNVDGGRSGKVRVLSRSIPFEEFDGGQERIVRRARPEIKRLEKARAEPSKDAVALGRGDEDVLLRHVGEVVPENWTGG
jgi:hypothetical protein